MDMLKLIIDIMSATASYLNENYFCSFRVCFQYYMPDITLRETAKSGVQIYQSDETRDFTRRSSINTYRE